MSERIRPDKHDFRQIPIPGQQLEAGVYGPENRLAPWGIIATLHPRAQTLAKHTGLRFAHSFDELDVVKIALIETSSATRVALVDHLGAPVAATEVHANVIDVRTADRVLHEVLGA